MKLRTVIGTGIAITFLSLGVMGSMPKNIQNQIKRAPSQLTYHPKTSKNTTYVKIINHDKATIKLTSWKYCHVSWGKLDSLNRASRPATAYLDRRNVGADQSSRTRQTVQPTGWHQKYVNSQPILNRGHLIAYSLTNGINQNGKYIGNKDIGDQNNWKNLFTQTAYANQRVQTQYETRVRTALKRGFRVIYRVQPKFTKDDLMAKSVHLQAVSKSKIANFNVEIANKQPGVAFDYNTGRSNTN